MIYILHDREGVKEKTEKTKNFNSYSNNNLCFGGLEEEESEEQNRTATESAVLVQPATTIYHHYFRGSINTLDDIMCKQ